MRVREFCSLVGANPSLSANQNEERVRQGSFFVCRHMGINLLNGNVHKYKKRELLCNFFILVCSGCPWQRFGITKKSLSYSFLAEQGIRGDRAQQGRCPRIPLSLLLYSFSVSNFTDNKCTSQNLCTCCITRIIHQNYNSCPITL